MAPITGGCLLSALLIYGVPAGAGQAAPSPAQSVDWSADDAKRLKALEQENAKLKKMLAERMLDIEVLKDINSKKW